MKKKGIMSTPLTIITWGKSNHKHWSKPPRSERNFDAQKMTFNNLYDDIDLERMRGDDDVLFERFIKTQRFLNFVKSIIKVVEKNNFKCISINCTRGRHRSRAVARAIGEHFARCIVIHKG
jgi:hypothetical protein